MSAPLICNYTIKARSDFGNSESPSSVNDVVMSWLRLRTTPLIASHIHFGHISSVLAPFDDIYGHISAPLLNYIVTRLGLGHIMSFLGWVTVEECK